MIDVEFIDEDTLEVIVMPMSRSRAPKIGGWRTINGRKLRRLPPSIAPPLVRMDKRHESDQLAPWTKGASSYGPNGEPRIAGQRDIDNILRENPNLNYGERKHD